MRVASLTLVVVALAAMGRTAAVADPPTAPWTVIFYVAGDDLASTAVSERADIIAGVASTTTPGFTWPKDIHVAILVDRFDKDAYQNHPDHLPQPPAAILGTSTPGRDLNQAELPIARSSLGTFAGNVELDMGSGDNLTRFLVAATTAYPSTRLAVFFIGHGRGWPATCTDRYLPPFGASSLRALTIRSALAAVKHARGDHNTDVVAFHSCLMSAVEIAAAVREQADYLVAPESLELADAWQYEQIAGALNTSAPITGADFARAIVTTSKTPVKTTTTTQNGTKVSKAVRVRCAIDLEKFDQKVLAPLDELGHELAPLIAYIPFVDPQPPNVVSDDVKAARCHSRRLSTVAVVQNSQASIDLWCFASQLGNASHSPHISAAMRAKWLALAANLAPGSDVFVALKSSLKSGPNSVGGISAFVPCATDWLADYLTLPGPTGPIFGAPRAMPGLEGWKEAVTQFAAFSCTDDEAACSFLPIITDQAAGQLAATLVHPSQVSRTYLALAADRPGGTALVARIPLAAEVVRSAKTHAMQAVLPRAWPSLISGKSSVLLPIIDVISYSDGDEMLSVTSAFQRLDVPPPPGGSDVIRLEISLAREIELDSKRLVWRGAVETVIAESGGRLEAVELRPGERLRPIYAKLPGSGGDLLEPRADDSVPELVVAADGELVVGERPLGDAASFRVGFLWDGLGTRSYAGPLLPVTAFPPPSGAVPGAGPVRPDVAPTPPVEPKRPPDVK
jgi:hypothetical protein